MPRSLILLISVIALSIASSVAAPVYKCKDEKGKVTFTDKKCDAEAKPQRIWDSNLGGSSYPDTFSGATPEESAAANAARGQGGGETMMVNAPVESRQEAEGYVCSTGMKSWVQNYPCPASVREPRVTHFTHSDGTWTDIETRSPTSVDQRGLSHSALCAELARPSYENESTYERAKMKRASGCP
jgi:hypothetical protein